MLHPNSPLVSPPILAGGGTERGIGVSLVRITEKRGGGGVTMSVMQACCAFRQRVWFRGDCCTTYALASCCLCPHPCGGPLTMARCDRWCRLRVGRIANRCCWFPVCVCVVSGTCGLICRDTCLACVHRVPCVCACSRCCVVCVRVRGSVPCGSIAADTLPQLQHIVFGCVW